MSNASLVDRVVYDPPRAAVAMTMQPRFGHTRDFTAVMGTQEEQTDYLLGLIFGGALALAVFVAWSVALFVLMCRGRNIKQNRIGFLSGRAFQLPSSVAGGGGGGSGSDLELTNNSKVANRGVKAIETFGDEPQDAFSTAEKHRQLSGRHTTIRLIFLLCGMIFIAFSFLLMIMGISNLETAMSSVGEAAGNVSSFASGIVQARNNIVGNSSEDFDQGVRDSLVVEFEDTSMICPADPSMENNGVARDVSQLSPDLVRLLNEGGNFLRNETQDLVELAGKVQKGAEQVQHATDTRVPAWVMWLILIPLVAVPGSLMVGTVLAMMDIRYKFHILWNTCVMMPLFQLMVLALWVYSSAMAIMAGVNSDFCLPNGQADESPDTTVMSMVVRSGYDESTIVYKAMDWYTSQCDASVINPFFVFDEFLPTLGNATNVVSELHSVFTDDGSLVSLQENCQRGYSVVVDSLQNLSHFLAALLEAVMAVLKITRCDEIADLYTATVYKSACTDSVAALTWIYSSTLAMAFFGMLMITLRSSYKPTRRVLSTGGGSGIHHAVSDEIVSSVEHSDSTSSGDPEVEANNAGGTTTPSRSAINNAGGIAAAEAGHGGGRPAGTVPEPMQSPASGGAPQLEQEQSPPGEDYDNPFTDEEIEA